MSGAFFKPIKGEDLRAASIDALEDMRGKTDAAYGAGSDSRIVMNVMDGQGSLADIKAFVKEAVAASGPAADD